MNRASDREARLVALEERVHELLQRIEVVSGRQDATAQDVTQMRELQAHMARSILKLNRELGAQREKYPLS